MKLKHKIISVISAVCFLASLACYSAYAAELLSAPSKDEDTGYTEQPDPGYTEPVTPDPGYTDPVTPDPGYTEEPVYSADPEPTYSDYTGYDDPSEYYPDDGDYSATYSDVISDGNFPQPDVYTPVYSAPTYVDNTQQYNQYLANQYQAQYDDNYIYVPEYEEPTESLVSTSSKVIDTDELTKEDWGSIMLDLSNGNLDTTGAQTFNFIKENEEQGDTNMMWLVYLGTSLILASVLLIIFVIVTTSKANAREKEEYYYI